MQAHFQRSEDHMSFSIYLVGFVIFTGGVAWAMNEAKIPGLYIGIACTILLGLGIMTAVSKTRTKDPS